MDRTTLTANLKPLMRRSLVEVSDDPADRRSRLMRLTPAGRSALAAAVPLWREAQTAAEHLVAGGTSIAGWTEGARLTWQYAPEPGSRWDKSSSGCGERLSGGGRTFQEQRAFARVAGHLGCAFEFGLGLGQTPHLEQQVAAHAG